MCSMLPPLKVSSNSDESPNAIQSIDTLEDRFTINGVENNYDCVYVEKNRFADMIELSKEIFTESDPKIAQYTENLKVWWNYADKNKGFCLAIKDITANGKFVAYLFAHERMSPCKMYRRQRWGQVLLVFVSAAILLSRRLSDLPNSSSRLVKVGSRSIRISAFLYLIYLIPRWFIIKKKYEEFWNKNPQGCHLHIWLLGTLPEHRGKGLASQLVLQTICEGVRRGLPCGFNTYPSRFKKMYQVARDRWKMLEVEVKETGLPYPMNKKAFFKLKVAV